MATVSFPISVFQPRNFPLEWQCITGVGRLELLRIAGEPAPLRKALGVEAPPPVRIDPAGAADPNGTADGHRRALAGAAVAKDEDPDIVPGLAAVPLDRCFGQF